MTRIKTLIPLTDSTAHISIVLMTVLFFGTVQAQPSAAAVGPDTDSLAAPATVVERMPRLIGGMESFTSALEYPERARQARLEGTVLVKFTVDVNGRVKNPDIVNGLGLGLDEEVLRVVSDLEFRPGRQGQERVPVLLYLPVTFDLP